MKQTKVNKKGDAVRHAVQSVTANAAVPNVTMAARSSIEVRGGKVLFRWRIYRPEGSNAK